MRHSKSSKDHFINYLQKLSPHHLKVCIVCDGLLKSCQFSGKPINAADFINSHQFVEGFSFGELLIVL